jgi:protein-S-isoprenylcysteine O-methyltransferase Ste14
MVLFYGVICYSSFLGTLLYLIGFLNDFLVPKGIDDGEPESLASGMGINTALILLFGIQHTIMARPRFKAWWKRTLPESIERSTFVLFSSAILILLFWQWRAMPGTIWHVESTGLAYALYGLQAMGWALVLLSSFLINHFELFGLQQVYLHWRSREPTPPKFRLPWLYRLIRHPLMLGFLVAFWSTPHMTQGHLVFTLAMTAYIFVGIHFEERDLVRNFGEQYREYQQCTGMILPIRRSPGDRTRS